MHGWRSITSVSSQARSRSSPGSLPDDPVRSPGSILPGTLRPPHAFARAPRPHTSNMPQELVHVPKAHKLLHPVFPYEVAVLSELCIRSRCEACHRPELAEVRVDKALCSSRERVCSVWGAPKQCGEEIVRDVHGVACVPYGN